jgi:hypothetical protein
MSDKEKIIKAIKRLNGNNLSKYLVLKTIDEATRKEPKTQKDADDLSSEGGADDKGVQPKKGR